MKKLCVVTLLFACFMAGAQPSIIPQPATIRQQEGSFTIDKHTVIAITSEADRRSAGFLNDYLQKYYGFSLKVTGPRRDLQQYILLSSFNDTAYHDQHESYQLAVSPALIRITANNDAGVFYGVQTLIQLLPLPGKEKSTALKIPAMEIRDQPRFGYRGIHLDVCRHFFPVSYVKQYIDYLALHKFNTFHWHLTDDQGWRIEIRKYPLLNTVAAWRNGTIIGRYPGTGNDSTRYGGYYTQEEIRDVVQYAADRFITVIPEIEMPGHASAAIAAYPELSCFPAEDTKIARGTAWAGPTKGKQVQQAWGVFDDIFCAGKETTFRFLEGVLDEVIALFPSKYIHIGGDEAPKTHWKRCPECQQRIKALGLKDEHQLQSYFTQRMEKYLNSKGRRIIGWDEILEGGLAPDATVMSWQGEKGGIEAAKLEHDVIMTPGNWCYFDHAQSRNEDSVTIGGYTPLEEVYGYEPLPAALDNDQAKHVLGAQANVWTEYIGNPRKVEYQLFPRIAAMSEVLWSAKDLRDSAGFEDRLVKQFERYNLWGVNYSRAFYDVIDSIVTDNEGLAWKFKTPRLKNAAVWFRQKYPETAAGNDQYTAWSPGSKIRLEPADSLVMEYFLGDRIPGEKYSKVFSKRFTRVLRFNKATGKNISASVAPSPAYPGNSGLAGLVNGVTADKFNSTEWLGWDGKPAEITIAFGKPEMITEIVLHTWKQEPSWIYLPQKIEFVFNYADSSNETMNAMEFEQPAEGWGEDRHLRFSFEPKMVTAVTIRLVPLMSIPEGRQGAGKPAWMFLDEIEMN
ncbi:MAG TPA: beta-N-acetylhexosaminidase [Chitinophagaceae bacterium]